MSEKGNQNRKYLKTPFVVYADTELLLGKSHSCDINSENFTTKISKHTACSYSLLTHCSFDDSKNKYDFYRSADCMKRFCADLKKHSTEIINYEKKENGTTGR